MKKRNLDIGLLILRTFIGFRIVYGVIDNILSWDKMLEFSYFLKLYLFPFPIISAVASVSVQFICGTLVLIGYKIRIASLLLMLNFTIALLFVHITNNDSLEIMTPALSMFFGSLTLLFTGGGRFSVK